MLDSHVETDPPHLAFATSAKKFEPDATCGAELGHLLCKYGYPSMQNWTDPVRSVTATT